MKDCRTADDVRCRTSVRLEKKEIKIRSRGRGDRRRSYIYISCSLQLSHLSPACLLNPEAPLKCRMNNGIWRRRSHTKISLTVASRTGSGMVVSHIHEGTRSQVCSTLFFIRQSQFWRTALFGPCWPIADPSLMFEVDSSSLIVVWDSEMSLSRNQSGWGWRHRQRVQDHRECRI